MIKRLLDLSPKYGALRCTNTKSLWRGLIYEVLRFEKNAPIMERE